MTEELHEELPVNEGIPAAKSAEADGAEAPPLPPRSAVNIQDSSAVVCYANFCRVTGTPEELILDFGLNAQPMEATGQIEIKQRLILNYFTAKRLLQALAMSVQRHEGAFGVLETDVQKRVVSFSRRAAAQA